MAGDTVTRTQLRQRLMEGGFFFSSTTTSAGAGGGTTLEDTEAEKFDTNRLSNKWVYITSGSADGEERRISSVSGTTITVSPAFSAQIASGVTYEVMPWRPTDVHRALEHGLRTVAPKIYVPKRDETLVVDNLISNFDFAAFSGGAFTDWSSKGTPSISQQTENGATFCRITASGATEGLEQDLLAKLGQFGEVRGKAMQVYGFIRCDTADSARMRVTFDGSTFENSQWHSGSNIWELIGPFSANITDGMSEATVSLEVEDGVTADFELVIAWVDPIVRYTIPSGIVSLRQVRMQRYISRPNGPFDPISTVQSGHLLRLTGLGRLTIPTTDSGTTELDDEQAEAVIQRAAMTLFLQQAGNDVTNKEQHLEDAQRAERRFRELIERPTFYKPKMSADSRYDGWHREEDGSGRYLMLHR